jgi:signal transduction histidine kinase
MTVLTSVLQSKVKEPEAVRIIEQIRENAGRLYSGTRDILWSLKPGADNLYEILHRIRDFGQDLFGDTDIQFVFTGSDERWREHRLSLDWSRNLTMIFKEALNNALKYAKATRVELSVELTEDDVLVMRLHDDGKGFDAAEIHGGHGLQNMKTRAGRLGGTLGVQSASGAGTALTLRFKIPQTAG